ncbi:hypothetical protein D3879_01545 [Pseudomonas cavernicola]|uniref:Uncharacterized protein n=1 Tax=Pseudomonas cavernicola TaxID=2320866 RepID=A0A418XHU0_9PSED|nr:hypothetical protein [Pseudomonas cavernicola]RJG12038.1 hypothetical protein D3879_01545 [Pseudomonas cavernicola]
MDEFDKRNPVLDPEKKSLASEDEFFGPFWSVRKTGDNFVLRYISGEVGGRLKELEITKEEFEFIRNGEIDINSVLLKYGAY